MFLTSKHVSYSLTATLCIAISLSCFAMVAPVGIVGYTPRLFDETNLTPPFEIAQ